ncbi:uncharacterized protein LOC130670969 isoform X2 [Microplitis mediator]|uniref:uncharacterized protein LOC130670969 isoform X2 n=1 Tax=Microplitis mediator TaxID=375433 RepID=UPI002556616D|nr:uncharacterized protein LOC130670969 isoform X2 [Microplitis mediator]
MNVQLIKLTASSILLTIFILTGIVNSTDVALVKPTTKDPVSTSSSALKLEARSEPLDNNDDNNINLQVSNSTKIYPVYPRSNDKSNPSDQIINLNTKDTYLEALEHSHSSKDPREGLVRVDPRPKYTKLVRRTSEGPVYRPEYGAPESSGYSSNSDSKTARIAYGSSQEYQPQSSNDLYSLPVQQSTNFNDQQNQYGPPAVPQTNYGTPSTSYGVPSTSYGVPSTSYGSPSTSYGPVQPQNYYGAPSSYLPAKGPTQGYGNEWNGYSLPQLMPSIDFSWPFALKLNAFTIAKILLKLVIFKMIVKFIAVICLLLFIPKLEMKKDDNDNDDDESRVFKSTSALERLNSLTTTVLDSIDKYQSINNNDNKIKKCDNLNCRVKRILLANESWSDYINLFKNYVAEEKYTGSEELHSQSHTDRNNNET